MVYKLQLPFYSSSAPTAVSLRVTGQCRGPKPLKFRSAVFAPKEVSIGPLLSHSHLFICGCAGDAVAIWQIHPLGISLPPLSVVAASPASMKHLMGKRFPAAFFRPLCHPEGYLNDLSSSFIFAAAKAGHRPAVDPHMGIDIFGKGDPQRPSLLYGLSQQRVTIVHTVPSFRLYYYYIWLFFFWKGKSLEIFLDRQLFLGYIKDVS